MTERWPVPAAAAMTPLLPVPVTIMPTDGHLPPLRAWLLSLGPFRHDGTPVVVKLRDTWLNYGPGTVLLIDRVAAIVADPAETAASS